MQQKTNLEINKHEIRLNIFLSYLCWLLVNAFFVQQAYARNETVSVVNTSRCMTFSKDQLVNKVPQFRKKNQVNSGSTVYSANFDLNDDGKLEYFYYLDDPGALSCGTISLQIGCPIKIYQQTRKKKLIDISGDAMYPGRDFNPIKHHGYLCLGSDKSGGWYNLITKNYLVHQGDGEGIFQFTGTSYEFINKGN